MAPVLRRQIHHLPPPPRPPNGPPATPVPVTKFISAKVFLQLFAGTMCIFFVAVVLWKLGKFFRFLTRDKVLGPNKTPMTRYARTWYGWVPMERHEANKRMFRKCAEKVHDWTSWQTSRADYRWVWWDPGQKELQKYRQRQKPLRWIPKCFRSYNFTKADEIWNPGPVYRQGASMSPADDPYIMSGALQNYDLFGYRAAISSKSRRRMKHSAISSPEEGSRHRILSIASEDGVLSYNSLIGLQPGTRRKQGRQDFHSVPIRLPVVWSLDGRRNLPRRRSCLVQFSDDEQIPRQTASAPCLLSAKSHKQGAQKVPTGLQDNEKVMIGSPAQYSSIARRYSRKYQVWSTRLQIKTYRLAMNRSLTLVEPPGSPVSELLASYSSDQNGSVGYDQSIKRRFIGRSSDSTNRDLSSLTEHPKRCAAPMNDQVPEPGAENWNSAPDLRYPSKQKENCTKRDRIHCLSDIRQSNAHFSRQRPVELPAKRTRANVSNGKVRQYKDPKRGTVAFMNRSDWELRLVNDLNRKLEWLLGQLNPGRRPFHFSLLANHWLNRETWIVIDPVSRVSQDARRQWGDSRFNTPYPAPQWGPRPKYPEIPQKVAHTPNINSWRAAVNRNRRASGIRDTIKATHLYDGSAEETPDGKVDPACWMLRKPPQGIGMSTKQKNAYYEGGAGWQETLSDWQKVRRGYRIRKAIHDGRANRTRAKQIAVSITRYCQKGLMSLSGEKLS